MLSWLFAVAAAATADDSARTAQAVQWMQARPAYAELLRKTLVRAGQSDALTFLRSVPSCPADAGVEGRVQSQGSIQVFYLARKLEDLAGPIPDVESYRAETTAQASQLGFAPATDAPQPSLRFDGELVEVRVGEVSHRQLCLRPARDFESQVELLVHELTHFTAPEGGALSTEEVADMGDPLIYGQRRVSRPGDEVDAYIAELSVRAQLRPPGSWAPPHIAPLFTRDGTFLGPRERIRDWVLNDLEYQRKRFAPEYRENLKLALGALKSRRDLLIRLVNLRSQQEKQLLEAGRPGSPPQALRLAEAASRSRARAMQEIGEVARRISNIERQLR